MRKVLDGCGQSVHAHALKYPLNLQVRLCAFSAGYSGYQHPLDQQVTVGGSEGLVLEHVARAHFALATWLMIVRK